MVGFGSSLRLARRPGWEGAYLDYEALKLLLSHIEAIYEEEGGSHTAAWDADMERYRSNRKARRKRRTEEAASVCRDYKEALFLESNSDLAYASVESSNEDDSSAEDVHHHHEDEEPQLPTAQPFTLSSYSQIPHDERSSEEEEDAMTSALCWGGTKNRSSANSTTTTHSSSVNSATKKSRPSRKKGTSSQLPSIRDHHEADQFYTSSKAFNNSYYRNKPSSDLLPKQETPPLKSYHHPEMTVSTTGHFQESLQYFPISPHPTEATALLHPDDTPPQQKPSLFTFATGGEALTPPTNYMYSRTFDPTASSLPTTWDLFRTPQTSATTTLQQPPLSHVTQRAAVGKKPRERPLRRRRRPRVVPHSLRLAHSKARAITERFLGLLRAETEKVLLFAQSRLGELADTAGSLRFPAFDEEYAANKSARYPSTTQGENYHFGDGLHPSASSSSEEGGSRLPWCSGSSEEEEEEAGLPPLVEDVPMTTGGPESDGLLYVRRQIAHFTELRKRRAIFQRNEHILGEDMLFLSAVEEADGYTAVGVELLHTLKYICVNLIAVRKICRKHDRLLMNRMLGGYYQRVGRDPNAHSLAHHGNMGAPTLGWMVARISGDTEETPSSWFQLNHCGHKLVGVYDQKIQMLANSPTIRVISSCLALSLSEYEVARSRADALTRLNSGDQNATAQNSNSARMADEEDSLFDAPSTASTVSLTRLRFTVMSVYALREVSRLKRNYFMTYLARSTLSFTGQPVIGEGLDGCTRETLDFLISYDPDVALLRDPTYLFHGLKKNRWSRLPMEQVMISVLSTATIEMYVSPDLAMNLLEREEVVVAHAVSANPDCTVSPQKLWTPAFDPSIDGKSPACQSGYQSPEFLTWNRISLFLFSLNYFLSHATTASFVKAAGSPASYSAFIIGAPNISAILMAIVHCWYGSKDIWRTEQSQFSTESIRFFVLFGSVMGVLGNAIHGYAMDRSSVLLAIVGRLFIGLSSAEILQRDALSMCGPAHVVAESGQLVLARILGSVVGLMIGGISAIPMDIQSEDMGKIYPAHARRVQFASWLVMLFWIVHVTHILMHSHLLRESDQKRSSQIQVNESKEEIVNKPVAAVNEESDSVSSSSAEIGTPSSVLYRPSLDTLEPIENAISVMERHSDWENASANSPLARREEDPAGPLLHRRQMSRHWKTVGRARKLLLFHVGIPITLLVYFYCSFALEVFFTATPFITDRYFEWSGEHSGLLLACLAAASLPLTFAGEIFARRYEERVLLKRALTTICWGLFLMVNWQSMFAMAELLPSVFALTDGRPRHLYDWKLGIFQYVIGLILVYLCLVALEGSALSLLSKLSPSNTRSLIVNVGSMATFLGLIARFLGDFQIVMIDLSDMIISMDIVNALVVPLILACFLLSYLIRKHFFILL